MPTNYLVTIRRPKGETALSDYLFYMTDYTDDSRHRLSTWVWHEPNWSIRKEKNCE